jgi:hypothetical protein
MVYLLTSKKYYLNKQAYLGTGTNQKASYTVTDLNRPYILFRAEIICPFTIESILQYLCHYEFSCVHCSIKVMNADIKLYRISMCNTMMKHSCIPK